jgi:proteasome lid subunit RPN8/RPN11
MPISPNSDAHTSGSRRLRLCIGETELRRLEDWSFQDYPLEACGLLLGRASPDGTRVHCVRRAKNRAVERAHERFELDPVDHLAAEDEALRLRLQVVGVWHSHPDRPPRPSESDRAGAWSGWSHLIVAVDARSACSVRSWRLVEGAFVEEEIGGAN